MKMTQPNNSIECRMKFDVPDGYFDSLADSVMQRISVEAGESKRRRSIVMRSVFAAAASLIAILMVDILVSNKTANAETNMADEYELSYTANLEYQCTDATVMECMMGMEESSSITMEAMDAIDLVSYYPAPINFEND